jgi:hypothetical protein
MKKEARRIRDVRRYYYYLGVTCTVVRLAYVKNAAKTVRDVQIRVFKVCGILNVHT